MSCVSESGTVDSGNEPPAESTSSSRPLFRELMAADVDDLETSEIDSLCMVCREMVSILDPSPAFIQTVSGIALLSSYCTDPNWLQIIMYTYVYWARLKLVLDTETNIVIQPGLKPGFLRISTFFLHQWL